jgi:hypothetical protein
MEFHVHLEAGQVLVLEAEQAVDQVHAQVLVQAVRRSEAKVLMDREIP